MRPFDALLFDLDGTLVATDRYWVTAAQRACHRAFAELGVEREIPTAREWLSLVGSPLDAGVATLLADQEPAVRELVLVRCREEESALIARGNAALFAGVEDVLDELKASGARLGIASNCGRDYLRQVGEALALDRWFDEMRCLDSPGVATKGDMLTDLLLTFDTRSAVMVGDRATDGEAARENGVPFVHVGTGYGEPDEARAADLRLDSLRELPAALARRTRALEGALDELRLPRRGPVSIGVTGRRAAGKTLFARDLARLLERAEREVAVVTLDAGLDDAYARGALAPEQAARWAEEVLRPHARGERVEVPREGRPPLDLSPGSVLVLEGPFLLEPRVATHLTRLVYLDVPEHRAWERLAGRDGRLAGPAPVARARSRDWPAELRFEERYPPERADLLLDGRALAPEGLAGSEGQRRT